MHGSRFTAVLVLVLSVFVACTAAAGAATLHRHSVKPVANENGGLFGEAVAVDGTTAVVGAIGFDGSAGAAFVFSDASGSWVQTQELTSPDPAPDRYFGLRVAISGSTIAVADYGVVRVYELQSGTWVNTQTLVPTSVSDFGDSIAIDGSVMVVGGDGGSAGAGAVDVYTLSAGTWTLAQQLTVAKEGPNDDFGRTVAINGTDIVVGAVRQIHGEGRVFDFRQVGGVWTKKQAFQSPAPQREEGFGSSLALSATTLAVTSNGKVAAPGDSAGTVYVYSDANAKHIWTLQATLGEPSTQSDPLYGNAIATDGNLLVVGAPLGGTGAGVAYWYTNSGGVWNQNREIDSPVAGAARFGGALAVQPGLALVGQPFTFGSPSGGIVYAYSGAAVS